MVLRHPGLRALLLVAGALAAGPASAEHAGEPIYQRVCSDCHGAEAKNKLGKGAPRVGDRRAWESRLNKGIEAIYKKIIDTKTHGKKDDPAWERANPFIWRDDLSDAQIRSALEYMFERADE